MKYTSVDTKSPVELAGKDARQIIRVKFSTIPASPLPSITAPVYLSGKIPASPKTEVWPTALVIPITQIQAHIIPNPAPGSNVAAKIGEIANITAITI